MSELMGQYLVNWKPRVSQILAVAVSLLSILKSSFLKENKFPYTPPPSLQVPPTVPPFSTLSLTWLPCLCQSLAGSDQLSSSPWGSSQDPGLSDKGSGMNWEFPPPEKARSFLPLPPPN